MPKVTALPGVKTMKVDKHYAVEGEMAKRITELVFEYAGQVSTVAAIGVLELVKNGLLNTKD
jgi:hypothetical protein